MIVLYIMLTVSASYLLTGVFRRYAAARKMIDVPNERSSHAVPTPRGGGAAIVLVMLAGLIGLRALGIINGSLFRALAGAGALVALIGWMDDIRDVPAGFRLAGHLIAAGWAVFCLKGLPSVVVFGTTVEPGWIGHISAAFYVVWVLNLYNFMDGIDGIAGIEAVTVCAGGVVLALVSGASDGLFAVPVLLASASAGFLFWNFPKAMVFMGDVGSGFIGTMLGVLSIGCWRHSQELFWGWLILLGAFVVDASVTLLRRALRGEKIYLPHRSHAYQRMALRLGAHAPVSLAYGAVNIFWLLPVAVLVAAGILDGASGLVVAYLPLAAAAVRQGAGRG